MSSSLIVFSHLRWDFVFQRPQHLLTRLARHHRVYFVEEPVFADGPPSLDVSEPATNVRVVRPRTPVRAPGFHDAQLPVLQRLLADLIEAEQLDDHALWFYTPMALPLAQQLNPSAVVYDCMDELSAFLHAPRQLLQRESALLKAADVVFTGGPSLYRAKTATRTCTASRAAWTRATSNARSSRASITARRPRWRGRASASTA
jgi:UDP-galactopyranose mutase